MAILKDLPGVQVSIFVNGQELHKYDDPDDDENNPAPDSVTKFIEAECGAEFSIRVDLKEEAKTAYKGDDPTDHSLRFAVYVDGEWQESKLYDFDNMPMTGFIWGPYASDKEYLPYQFAQFSISSVQNGIASTNAKKKAKNLGTIEVRQDCRKWIGYKPSKFKQFSSNQTDVMGLSEKELKGSDSKSLQIRYGVARATEAPTFVSSEMAPGAKTVFKFKYRSKEDLKRLCIIPRSPSPTQAVDRDLDDLDADQLRQIILNQRADLDALAVEIKKEFGDEVSSNRQASLKRRRDGKDRAFEYDGDGADDDDVIFVSERPAKRRKSAPGADDEVIDVD